VLHVVTRVCVCVCVCVVCVCVCVCMCVCVCVCVCCVCVCVCVCVCDEEREDWVRECMHMSLRVECANVVWEHYYFVRGVVACSCRLPFVLGRLRCWFPSLPPSSSSSTSSSYVVRFSVFSVVNR
jgi:hypothetical protein